MGLRKKAPAPAEETAPAAKVKPDWAKHLDDEERPNREDLSAGHNVFMDSMLSPVPLPKWLRGKRRQQDKLS
jgi:hypothetical protein